MTRPLVALLLGLGAALGVYLLYTSVVLGWRGLRLAPPVGPRRPTVAVRERLSEAGLDHVRPVEFLAVVVVLFAVAAAFAHALYGGVPAAVAAGLAAGSIPVVSARNRRRARRELAREAWPRMIEEIRLETVTLGRSIPQAVLSVGASGPEELRPAFIAAQREWHRSTDLERALAVLCAELADPTADAVCETLLVAHEVGGSDVDQRLRALTEDRLDDLQGRKDARARQAGVRFARSFVIVVPVGMAMVGLGIGDGRAAFQTASGQLWVLAAFAMMAGCWVWASQLLRLPEQQRVFQVGGSDGEVST